MILRANATVAPAGAGRVEETDGSGVLKVSDTVQKHSAHFKGRGYCVKGSSCFPSSPSVFTPVGCT
jgi:hypothetical protein